MKDGAAAPLRPVNLRCEYMTNPVGIGERIPRLSWSLGGEGRGRKQTAYRILVATSPERLRRNEADLWDSGQVASDRTVHIPYAGRPLTSRLACYWKVIVWSEDGQCAESEPAFWEMGLLEPEDWHAQWIGLRTGGDGPLPDLGENEWIWLGSGRARAEGSGRQAGPAGGEADGDARAGYFRRAFYLPEDVPVRSAWLLINADTLFRQYTNGFETARAAAYAPRLQWVDLTYFLRPGNNALAVEVHKRRPTAGLIGRLDVELADGTRLRIDVDAAWRCSPEAEPGWTGPDFDDAHWQAAVPVARYGAPPWGEQKVQARPAPAPFLRRRFFVRGRVAKARAYATALGVYELRLNGEPVSDAHFAPGWSDYRRRLMVQTYDVTCLLRPGDNVLGAVLGDGWYAGHVGFFGRHVYGPYPLGLLAQLEVEYEDGRKERIATDGSWEGAEGPIIASDLLMGEIYDARRELTGWDRPDAPAAGTWRPVEVLPPYTGELVPQVGPDVRTVLQLRPVARTEPEPGVYIFDMGQNMVGRVRLTVRGARPGQRITLRHGEVLEPDGTLYTINLRSARQTDTYICRGGAEEVFEPHFTFHGFRYVEVRGYPGEPPLDAVVGQVIHSDTPFTGYFECSHPLVNRLQHNIVWGQRGNFLSVPTDCPQRDERLGWTGDAQVFARTAACNADVAAFFTKWLADVADAQFPDGAFADIAPNPGLRGGTAAWGDAGVIVPWTLYLCYGDTRIIERHYEAMQRWIAYLQRHSKQLIRPAAGYGDWLAVGADTPKDVIATAFFAYSTRLLACMARAIGRHGDAAAYEQLFAAVREAFNQRFVTADGRIHGDTQTAYVLGLHMDLLRPEQRAAALRRLADDIRRRGNRLTTGFVGTPYLLPVLTEGGEVELAYTLLTSTEYPSWGYMIEHGATTVWERWDAYRPDAGFQDPGMNSFNHYAFGSVGEWLQRYVAGIDVSPQAPGFERVVIRPHPGGGITWVKARYVSVRGPVAVEWRVEEGTFTLRVALPPNTEGVVYLPAGAPECITESGVPLDHAACVRLQGVERTAAGPRTVVEIGSGEYVFSVAGGPRAD